MNSNTKKSEKTKQNSKNTQNTDIIIEQTPNTNKDEENILDFTLALDFVNEVDQIFHGDSKKFEEFDQIIREINSEKTNPVRAYFRLIYLLENNTELLQKLNHFLIPEYKIDVELIRNLNKTIEMLRTIKEHLIPSDLEQFYRAYLARYNYPNLEKDVKNILQKYNRISIDFKSLFYSRKIFLHLEDERLNALTQLKQLSTPSQFQNLLKSLHLFSIKIINRKSLDILIENIFKDFPDCLNFAKFLIPPPLSVFDINIDSLPKITSSYYKLPNNMNFPSANILSKEINTQIISESPIKKLFPNEEMRSTNLMVSLEENLTQPDILINMADTLLDFMNQIASKTSNINDLINQILAKFTQPQYKEFLNVGGNGLLILLDKIKDSNQKTFLQLFHYLFFDLVSKKQYLLQNRKAIFHQILFNQSQRLVSQLTDLISSLHDRYFRFFSREYRFSSFFKNFYQKNQNFEKFSFFSFSRSEKIYSLNDQETMIELFDTINRLNQKPNFLIQILTKIIQKKPNYARFIPNFPNNKDTISHGPKMNHLSSHHPTSFLYQMNPIIVPFNEPTRNNPNQFFAFQNNLISSQIFSQNQIASISSQISTIINIFSSLFISKKKTQKNPVFSPINLFSKNSDFLNSDNNFSEKINISQQSQNENIDNRLLDNQENQNNESNSKIPKALYFDQFFILFGKDYFKFCFLHKVFKLIFQEILHNSFSTKSKQFIKLFEYENLKKENSLEDYFLHSLSINNPKRKLFQFSSEISKSNVQFKIIFFHVLNFSQELEEIDVQNIMKTKRHRKFVSKFSIRKKYPSYSLFLPRNLPSKISMKGIITRNSLEFFILYRKIHYLVSTEDFFIRFGCLKKN
ncbi:sin3b-related [Anaeramoeba ignava]|uniref:Sin3b-related n=1 Tax=Anaeramoeba ignava TaxID=1746090 RepID=A0A9Q0LD98_ANAIG|nr:sin3b-related [Anaeramoeba ignava]